MKTYICPQCGEEFNKLCGPVDEEDLDLEYENPKYQYFECPECGYRDRKTAFNDEEYIPSSTNGDYSPSNPWDAPGMKMSDFI